MPALTTLAQATINQNFFDYIKSGFQYLFEHWDRVSDRFFQHLQITGFSLGVALLIAIPLGVLISRVGWLSAPVLSILGVLYTIPSLAFLAFLVPIYGLGFTTTVIALITYAQTQLVRNIAIGFRGIDPAILEAARGMGMSNWQIFYKIELPLAAPIAVAGMRIATLSIISIATVGAFVGAEDLGSLMKPNNAPRVIAAGIILIILIAVVADQFFRLIERLLAGYRTRRMPKPKANPTPKRA
jgi:osmoprotectant transport system permease protein